MSIYIKTKCRKSVEYQTMIFLKNAHIQYVLFSLENFSLAQPDPSEGLGKPRHGAANDFRTSAFSQNIKSLFTMTN